MIPALLTRTSSFPCFSTTALKAGRDRRGVGDVEARAPRPTPRPDDRRGDGGGLLLVPRRDDDVRARASARRLRDRLADPLRAAGDEGDLPFERDDVRHRSSRLSPRRGRRAWRPRRRGRPSPAHLELDAASGPRSRGGAAAAAAASWTKSGIALPHAEGRAAALHVPGQASPSPPTETIATVRFPETRASFFEREAGRGRDHGREGPGPVTLRDEGLADLCRPGLPASPPLPRR